MEEMYFAWLENPQSVHKVSNPPPPRPPLPLCRGEVHGAGLWRGSWGEAACLLSDLGPVTLPPLSRFIKALSLCGVGRVCCFPVAEPASG